ncbi:MAG: Mth938-like domain-containing protein [Burkholderiales bacterium]|nr:Mth938-like domain-containing protein [Burkholderiales bacterium]
MHLSRPDAANQITACGQQFVAVNGVRYQRSLLVMPDAIVPDWPVAQLAALTAAHIEALLASRPEVVLLGTGAQLTFPPAAVLRPLIDAGIGYEIMDTGAACRTYAILMGEGRRVLAALIVA